MAIFDSALRFVLVSEGGLDENKDGTDSGGVTNGGISLKFLQSLGSDDLQKYEIFGEVNEQAIKDLTPDQIRKIYAGEFWNKAPFDKIMNQILCNYIFDMCVNHGMSNAIKMVQRAIWACQKKRDYILDDGVLGSKTISAINQASFMLQFPMIAQRDAFYRGIVALHPAKKGDLNGWLNRCYRI